MTFWRYFWRWARRIFLLLFIVGLVVGGLYVLSLDQKIRSEFIGDKWPEPSRLYASPTELFVGAPLQPTDLAAELKRLGYTQSERVQQAGTWRQAGRKLYIGKRPFVFWDGAEPYQRLEITFDSRGISALVDYDSRADVAIARLDPEMIGSVYPRGGEDRILVKLDDVPPMLVGILKAVEDRDFDEHIGVHFRGIARAIVTNISSGRMRQGGSTLTQQLVKNYFLTSERTLRRKAEEAVMAILLELRHEKSEILEGYINEVFLSQDGDRAVHGFGLASYYFFGKPLAEIETHQMALLVGMVKGPTAYNPLRRPEGALKRRNTVIAIMVSQGLVTKAEGELLGLKPLDVLPTPQVGTSRYPAFTQLVKRQLARDYNDEDLRSEGLRIFTTLDTRVQQATEQSIQEHLQARDPKTSAKLQAAAVLVNVHTGEVSAIAGDRDSRTVGFNRALDARRQIGSLIKPLIYLTALQRPFQYTLATPLDDSPLDVARPGQPSWRPKNYSGEFVGAVPLYRALAQSYNIPAIRVGMDLGADSINDVIQGLTVPPFAGEDPIDLLDDSQPSGYLGAVEMSPYQVAQIYNGLASGGFVTPLNAIRSVLTSADQPLDRYPLEINRRMDQKSVYLINQALQKVTTEGSARSLQWRLPDWLAVAGKTGTTNGTRDSWFAGFSGDKLGVVWVGDDNNASTGLTGSSGALPIWAKVFNATASEPYIGIPPENLMEATIEPESGLLWGSGCEQNVVLPFILDSAPTDKAPCTYLPQEGTGGGIGGHSDPVPPPPPAGTKPWWERLFD